MQSSELQRPKAKTSLNLHLKQEDEMNEYERAERLGSDPPRVYKLVREKQK